MFYLGAPNLAHSRDRLSGTRESKRRSSFRFTASTRILVLRKHFTCRMAIQIDAMHGPIEISSSRHNFVCLLASGRYPQCIARMAVATGNHLNQLKCGNHDVSVRHVNYSLKAEDTFTQGVYYVH